MASEITYAEVKFKNASPAAMVKGKEWMAYSGEGDLEGEGLKNREERLFLLWLVPTWSWQIGEKKELSTTTWAGDWKSFEEGQGTSTRG